MFQALGRHHTFVGPYFCGRRVLFPDDTFYHAILLDCLFDCFVFGFCLFVHTLYWTTHLNQKLISISHSGIDTVSLYIASGEFDLKSVRTYQSDVGGPAEETIYRKLYFEFTFRRKWQFFGQNLVCALMILCALVWKHLTLPNLLCFLVTRRYYNEKGDPVSYFKEREDPEILQNFFLHFSLKNRLFCMAPV